MAGPHPLEQLGRRERQIMDILLRLGRASAAEVQAQLGDPVSNSAVRGMLRYLASKGYVEFDQEGPRYVYFPATKVEDVQQSVLKHLVSTFFGDSPSSAMAALLDLGEPLGDEEYQRLSKLLKAARKEGSAS